MGKYTLEIRELLNDPLFTLFDFEYDFYLVENKKNFETLFIDHYFYSEIGFETVHRFKKMLKHKLDLIAPYYKQLYDTELKSKDISFLLNKDLKETYTKNTTLDSTVNGTTDTIYKESNIENGNADVNLTSGNLTNVNNNIDTVDSNNKNVGSEDFTLISQGNIGTTSSAQLLRDWRSILINIDELIIDECRSLFMGVY